MIRHQKGVWVTRLSWILAVVLLVASGVVYRIYAPRWKGTGQRTIKLPVPLGQFPLTVGHWAGRPMPIEATTQEYMRQNFADDFFSHHYTHEAARAWADVYVVYCASRPAGILGHRPGVCYPAHGWITDSTDTTEFTSLLGMKIPCLIQRFHKPVPNYQEAIALSFYVVNGQVVINEKAFSGLMGRNPNISGDPAKYVAQVQISSVFEDSIRRAAADMADVILDFLPDKNGVVKAAANR
jgi:hypothetical protein